MAEHLKSAYEGVDLRAVRPYLIVGNAMRRSTSTGASSRRRSSNATRPRRVVSVTRSCESARRSSRSASIRMRRAALPSACHASGFGCTSPMSTRRTPGHWLPARPGTHPPTACRVHVRRVSTIRSASPGGLRPRSSSRSLNVVLGSCRTNRPRTASSSTVWRSRSQTPGRLTTASKPSAKRSTLHRLVRATAAPWGCKAASLMLQGGASWRSTRPRKASRAFAATAATSRYCWSSASASPGPPSTARGFLMSRLQWHRRTTTCASSRVA